MSTLVVERVDDWNERPFSGGYRELHDLADSGFSGVVRAGGAELYMTKGTVVGVRRGSIEDFEEASGTIYDAPTDALPLLAVMQERSDEVRAKYYSEDTGISEVDRTLEDGGFTGYVELSENVLSGDYYLVYHQGHSMSVAFVGNAEKLLTEDEAFQRADDEVGIYEVRPVDIEPVEIPEPTEPEPEGAVPGGVPEDEPDDDTESAAGEAATASAAETVVDAESEPASDDEPVDEAQTVVADEPSTAADEDRTGETSSASNGQTAAASVETPDRGERADDETAPAEPEPADESAPAAVTDQPPDAEPESDQRDRASETEPARTESETETSRPEESRVETPTVDETAEATPTRAEREPSPEQTVPTSTEQTEPEPTPSDPVREPETQEETPPTPEPGRQRQQTESAVEETPTSDGPSQLETRSVPSLDPERTSSRSRSSGPRRDAPNRSEESQTGGGAAAQSAGQREQAASRAEQTSTTEQSASSSEQAGNQQSQSQSTASQQSATESPDTTASVTEEQRTTAEEPEEESGSGASERLEELQELLSERETEIRKLETELENTAAERDSVRRELEQVREERDELQEQVEKLESELQRLEEELGAATNAQQRMTPQEALSGTDIFVRYRSKGDATLEKAHDGGARKQDVSDNLRLENHTQFDADISAVGGREYDEFIEDTVAYKFVRWVVEDLLFEIQSTGHTESLKDLYNSLPKINRVELNGAVNVTYSEDGQETETTESFDVVFRERMGDPLLVANINDSRQGASESMMEGLITAAERVGQTSDQFASAFLVTESFFEPEALETVAEATRGGILSRDKRKSFVNLSRKRGYHLCLVEARNQNFHLEVPEL